MSEQRGVDRAALVDQVIHEKQLYLRALQQIAGLAAKIADAETCRIAIWAVLDTALGPKQEQTKEQTK